MAHEPTVHDDVAQRLYDRAETIAAQRTSRTVLTWVVLAFVGPLLVVGGAAIWPYWQGTHVAGKVIVLVFLGCFCISALKTVLGVFEPKHGISTMVNTSVLAVVVFIGFGMANGWPTPQPAPVRQVPAVTFPMLIDPARMSENKPWVRTGYIVEGPTRIMVMNYDIKMDGQACDPEGCQGVQPGPALMLEPPIMPQERHLRVLARVGNEKPFGIGGGALIRPAAPGELMITLNQSLTRTGRASDLFRRVKGQFYITAVKLKLR